MSDDARSYEQSPERRIYANRSSGEGRKGVAKIVNSYRSRSKERVSRSRSKELVAQTPSRSRSRSPSVRKAKRKYSRSRSRSRSPHVRSYKSSKRRASPPPKPRSRHHSRSYSRSVSYSPPPYRRGKRSHSRSPMSSRRRHNGNRVSHNVENPEPNRCLGVFGLSIYTTEQEIYRIFSKYGPIENVNVVIDVKTGHSRGFCFVYFENCEDAKAAKEQCSGMEIDGRKIRVDYSITQRAHTPTPGIYMGKPSSFYERRYDRRDRGWDRDYYGGGGGGGGGYRGGGGGGRYRSPSPYYHSSRSRRRYDRYSRSRSRSYSPGGY